MLASCGRDGVNSVGSCNIGENMAKSLVKDKLLFYVEE